MTVGEFCNRQVVIAHRDESVVVAARRIRDFHVGTLIVVDERDGRRIPIGMVTDRDLVVRALAELRPEIDAPTVGHVMTPGIVTSLEGEDLLDALKKMRSFGIRRLAIVDEHGGLEGIVAFDDLVDLAAEELSHLSQLVAREQSHEREGERR